MRGLRSPPVRVVVLGVVCSAGTVVFFVEGGLWDLVLRASPFVFVEGGSGGWVSPFPGASFLFMFGEAKGGDRSW